MKTKWTVGFASAGTIFGPRQEWVEDGYVNIWPVGWVVAIQSAYGHEYYHSHRFATEKEAERFHDKVESAFEKGSQPDLQYWNGPRTIYGTQAYLDEEPAMVARERADDLLWGY